MSATMTTGAPAYILGHSEAELNRLIEQGRFFNPLSAALLQSAGITEGMRVLDVGCGAGDMAFLAAELVGPEGSVTGVDASPAAIAIAERRAADAGLANVRFVQREAAEMALDEPCDALIGRLILMYFADPAVALRRLAANVRLGGVVVFQEMDMQGAASYPRCPLFDTTIERMRQAFRRAGIDVRAGLALGRIFEEAGLPTPEMTLSARVERGPDSPIYGQAAGITRTLLPLMEQTGIASAAEIEVESLARRLREEAMALNATLVSPTLIGAWTRVRQ